MSECKHCNCSCKENETLVKVFNESNTSLPEYQTPGSAGMDLRYSGEDTVLKPMERKLFKTGLHIQLPTGTLAYVQSRSGLALKHGVFVLNTPGLIDSDYIGEICVILMNSSDTEFEVKHGDRIAQMVVLKYEKVLFDEVNKLTDLETTERGEGGFGHTNVK